MISDPDCGKLPAFWGSMVFCHAPSLGRGRVTNNKKLAMRFVCSKCRGIMEGMVDSIKKFCVMKWRQ